MGLLELSLWDSGREKKWVPGTIRGIKEDENKTRKNMDSLNFNIFIMTSENHTYYSGYIDYSLPLCGELKHIFPLHHAVPCSLTANNLLL